MTWCVHCGSKKFHEHGSGGYVMKCDACGKLFTMTEPEFKKPVIVDTCGDF